MTEWYELTLGDLLTLQRGFDLTQKESNPGMIPVISSGGSNYTTDVAKVSGPGVVTGRKGVLGKVHWSDGAYWPHDTTLWVRDFKGAVPRFVYYLLQTLPLAELDAGAANPTLNRNHAHLLPIRVPDPGGQAVIAEILWGFDRLIENNRRRVEVLEDMARTIFREWFVKFRYPGHEDVPLVDSALGLIPDGWGVAPASKAIAVNPRIKMDRSIDHPFMTMGDLDERGMSCRPSQVRKGGSGAKFEQGDTLFARITPCLENGKTGLVQTLADVEVGLGSTEFIVLRGQDVGSAFTYCLAREDGFRKHAVASMSGASGRQRVRNECFDTYLLAVPTPDVADAFELRMEPLFAHVAVLTDEALALGQLRDLLLPKLVTGQIDVSTLDLDVLLSTSSTAGVGVA